MKIYLFFKHDYDIWITGTRLFFDINECMLIQARNAPSAAKLAAGYQLFILPGEELEIVPVCSENHL